MVLHECLMLPKQFGKYLHILSVLVLAASIIGIMVLNRIKQVVNIAKIGLLLDNHFTYIKLTRFKYQTDEAVKSYIRKYNLYILLLTSLQKER